MKKAGLKILRRKFNKDCLERDKNKCVFCKRTYNLDVHHITDRKLMPNDGYHLLNGITLCSEHHWYAEEFHMTGKSLEGFSPEDLYEKIGSSYEKAYEACIKLDI